SGDSAAVATVNGVDITKDKLYSELVKVGGTQTLDNMITEELIDQEVKKAKITVTEADLTKEIETVKKNFATEDEFNAALTQSGMTLEDLKTEMNIQV
ncbi:SurA N-terminal domain-containing protein, partial [Escherichia coli]|uniref:SurA N-terminal domain-containing protein n=1 Tax=Escherichia coli TaxID=562 RepID=UPI00307A96C1